MNNTYTHTDEGFNFDFEKIKRIILGLAIDPKANWVSVQNEYTSIKALYLNFILPVLLVRAISSVIKMSVIGIDIPFMGVQRMPLVSTIISSAVMIFVTCLMFYLGAFIITKLAPMFQGSTDTMRALRFVAFSSALGMVASIAILIPWIGFLISLFASLYGIYIFFQGITPMINVPESERIKFTVVAFVIMFVVGIVVSLITAPLQLIGGGAAL